MTRFFARLLPQTREAALVAAALMILVIAVADRATSRDIPLGFLYLFPMLIIGRAYGRTTVAGFAVISTVLAEIFDDTSWTIATGVPRDILYFAAFSCMGFSVYEATRSGKLSRQHTEQLEREMIARREAEEQLQVLVDSSPAAIFTAGSDGTILLANDAAHRLFAVREGTLPGKSALRFLPSLIHVLGSNRQSFRTTMQCRGHRATTEVFQAEVWFSTYLTSAGSRLAAMVLDTSEELRLREQSSLEQLLASSRILMAAVSHEIRNVCGAIAFVHENLTRTRILKDNKDFEALGTLVLSLERIAAMDLRQSQNGATSLEVRGVLEELRIVIEEALLESGVAVEWQIANDLPLIWADRQSLMQVFLNLTKNSERAMEESSRKRLTIAASRESGRVAIRVSDTGCGVAHPERLFRPFQPDAKSTGLGLYLSRAFMRSFGGELRYEAAGDAFRDGATFVVELSPALREGKDGNDEWRNSDSVGGRPWSVPGEPEPAPTD